MGIPIQPSTPAEPSNPLEDIVEEPKWMPTPEEIVKERDRGRSVPSPIRLPLAALMQPKPIIKRVLLVSVHLKISPLETNEYQHVFMAPIAGTMSQFKIYAKQGVTMKMHIMSGEREISENPYPLSIGPNSFPWTAEMAEFDRLEISCPIENELSVAFQFGRSGLDG